MSGRQFHLHGGKKGAAVAIRVTPRASRNEISEILSDGTIKARLTALAEGKANAVRDPNSELLLFLAEVLEIPPSNLEIIAGDTGHDKLISILDLDAETVHSRILKRLV